MTMPSEPMPQRSGREVLLNLHYKMGNYPADDLINITERQLFNAIFSEVIGESESSATEDNSSPTDRLIQSVRNDLRAEQRQRLRVFFNQPQPASTNFDQPETGGK